MMCGEGIVALAVVGFATIVVVIFGKFFIYCSKHTKGVLRSKE
jgi:hypothetical protein